MSGAVLYSVAGVLLFSIGLYGVMARVHLFRRVLAFNVMGSGVFLFLISVADRVPGAPPDPVPHAMVLTGIVVTVSATAFALSLIKRISSDTGAESLGKNGPGHPDPGDGQDG